MADVPEPEQVKKMVAEAVYVFGKVDIAVSNVSRRLHKPFEPITIEDWDWVPDSFDVVAAIFIQFADPALRSLIFEGMKRTVKPGGLLLMQGYRPEQIEYATGGPRARENLYTRALLEEAFAGFAILRLHEHDDEIREGPGHAGMSALIDLIARKPAA